MLPGREQLRARRYAHAPGATGRAPVEAGNPPGSASGHVEYRMVRLPGSVLERGGDVTIFQVRVILENFLAACPCREQIENVLHPHAEAAEARPAAALFGVNRNAIQLAHRQLPATKSSRS